MNSITKFCICGIVLFGTLLILQTQIKKSEIYYNKYNSVYKEHIKLINVNELLNYKIDSTQCIIDSLKERYYNLEQQLKKPYVNDLELINAIISIESSGMDSAYNESEGAVGCLQIRHCMVDDVNRILKRQNSPLYYTYEDRWNRNKSIEMFNIFIDYYNLNTPEEIARCWNGGPRGINNPYTIQYWNKVELELEDGYASR